MLAKNKKLKPIGGFFELELPNSRYSYHSDAIALSTGRACIGVIIESLKPSKVYLPFYTCNATITPFINSTIEIEYLEIDINFEYKSLPKLKKEEFIFVINYFGIKKSYVRKLIEKFRDKLIIDNTHDFFQKSLENNWSFTSARKYFGVPDGAYLYSPFENKFDNLDRFKNVKIRHNLLRLLGKQKEAYKEYVAYEESLDCSINRISIFSEKILSLIDYEEVRLKRLANFNLLHQNLKHLNTLQIDICQSENPFCYPLLPEEYYKKTKFYHNELFIPTLWADTTNRGISGFQIAKKLTNQLLPLPIDHRYNEKDMLRISSLIKSIIK